MLPTKLTSQRQDCDEHGSSDVAAEAAHCERNTLSRPRDGATSAAARSVVTCRSTCSAKNRDACANFQESSVPQLTTTAGLWVRIRSRVSNQISYCISTHQITSGPHPPPR